MDRHHVLTRASVLGALALAQGGWLAGPAGAADATVLPGVAGYGNANTVYAISGDGMVLAGSGACNLSLGQTCPTVWQGNPPVASFVSSPNLIGSAQAASADGTAIGFNNGPDASVSRGNFNYGLLDANGNSTHTRAVFGLSQNGDIAVGSIDTGQFVAGYWQWDAVNSSYGNAQLLPLLGSGVTSFALGISGDGGWIVGTANDGAHARAVYWWGSPGSYSAPVTLDQAYTSSTAFAISTNSETIVGFVSDGTGDKAAFWRTDGSGYGATQVIALPSAYSQALAVSGNGLVIGGYYDDGTVTSRAFLYSVSSGTAGDLNTLLAAAGLNMGGVKLTDVTGLSYDGTYIAANSDTNGYRIFYDGTIAGLSDTASQQASLDDLQRARQSIAIQQDAYAGLMTGDLDRVRSGAELGAFGLYGSAAGGLKGRAGWGDSVVLTAGVAGGTGDHDALSYKGLMGAAALRYDFLPMANGWRAFGQVGGAFGRLNDLSFARTYANGAGSATGIGNTSGQIASLYARLGLTGDLSPQTQVQIAAELGERWLSVDGYAETLSAGNPFPATIASGTDRQTVGKIAATWTQALGDRADFTLRGAVGTTLEGTSGLAANISGFGTMTADLERAVWAEAGLRIGYRASDQVTVDAFATGIAGKTVGTAGHVGAGVRVGF